MKELNNRSLAKKHKLQMNNLFAYTWKVGIATCTTTTHCDYCKLSINKLDEFVKITAKEKSNSFCDWGELFEWLDDNVELASDAQIASELRSQNGFITAQPVGYTPSSLGRYTPSSSDGEYTSLRVTRTTKIYED